MKNLFKVLGGGLFLCVIVLLIVQAFNFPGSKGLSKFFSYFRSSMVATVFTPATADVLVDVTAATSTCATAGFTFNTNCFSTVQAGINAATVGQTVGVEAGTYTGPVTINKRISLIGAGNSQTIITGGSPVLTLAATGILGNPILLKNFQVKGFSAIYTGTSSISYVEFDGLLVAAITYGSGYGFRILFGNSVDHLTVTNCIFENFYAGWYVERKPGSGYRDTV